MLGLQKEAFGVTFRVKRSPDSAGANDSFKQRPRESMAKSASPEKQSGWVIVVCGPRVTLVGMGCPQDGRQYHSVCTTGGTVGCLTLPHALACPPSATTCHGTAAPCRETLMGDRRGCQEVTPRGHPFGALPPMGDPARPHEGTGCWEEEGLLPLSPG